MIKLSSQGGLTTWTSPTFTWQNQSGSSNEARVFTHNMGRRVNNIIIHYPDTYIAHPGAFQVADRSISGGEFYGMQIQSQTLNAITVNLFSPNTAESIPNCYAVLYFD